jgi:hypothetical protein
MFLLCCLVALLVGCKSSTAALPEPSKETTTSIKETITIRDTIFKTEKDSSYYNAYIECVNGKPVLTKPKATPGKNLKAPKVDLTGNELKVDCIAEAQELFYQWKEKYITENKSETIRIPYAVTTPLSWWQTTQIWCGRLFLFLFLAFLVAVYLRFKKII